MTEAVSDLPKGLARDDEGVVRCWWCGEHDDYRHYHDHEWGRPMHDDHRLFEKICLEGFQSGLSWLTILRKREGFREAFHGFDFERVARMKERDVERLVGNAAIVRHRGKIESTINNAKRAIELADAHDSLDAYFWTFVPPAEERPKKVVHAALSQLGKTPTSTRLSKELKKKGWSFVGPTTVYAFMQAMGLVNDHLEGCHVRDAC
ncbi:MAG: DNA-3-methyladenine glycosylase I [Polyangiales bacterium]